MVTKRVYPDTNVAMHYRPFEEIDWCSLVDADEVVLVITRVFLSEIDSHKDHKRGTLQARARRTSAWLGDLRKTKAWTIRANVRVEVTPADPPRPCFEAHGLDPMINDDRLVASMVRDHELHPNVPVVCVTADNALAFKVEAAAFESIEPPAAQRLPDEPDPSELENRELRKKLLELEKRVAPAPELSLEFPGSANLLGVELRGTEAPSDDYVDEELAAERASLDLVYRMVPSILQRPPSAKAVDRYLDQLREWMLAARDVAVERAHTFDVRLVLANDGNGNAADIEIELTFPENVFVAETRRLPSVEKRPTRPEPRDLYMRGSAFRPIDMSYARVPSFRLPARQPERLVFDAKNSHHVRVLVDGAKHRTQIELPKFQAWFERGKTPSGFQIAYRIHAATPPVIEEGVLRARVDVRPGPASMLRFGEGADDVAEADEADVSDPDDP